MNKKIYILGLIVIIILGLFFQMEFGGYYHTPEEAAEHNDVDGKSIKTIIETVWVEDDRPIIFYVSNTGEFCEIEFYEKQIFGMTGWKCRAIKTIDTNDFNSNEVAPTRMGSGKLSDKKPQVLFGITKSPKAETIKVNGDNPTFKNFEIEGQDYTLWYIIADLTNYSSIDEIKITSNSK